MDKFFISFQFQFCFHSKSCTNFYPNVATGLVNIHHCLNCSCFFNNLTQSLFKVNYWVFCTNDTIRFWLIVNSTARPFFMWPIELKKIMWASNEQIDGVLQWMDVWKDYDVVECERRRPRLIWVLTYQVHCTKRPLVAKTLKISNEIKIWLNQLDSVIIFNISISTLTNKSRIETSVLFDIGTFTFSFTNGTSIVSLSKNIFEYGQ